jgi:hypothetical protein
VPITGDPLYVRLISRLPPPAGWQDDTCTYATIAAEGYAVADVQRGSIIEHRFFRDGHHFMTLLEEGGAIVVRPHPGVDPNGWGSSWYAQPFLPGAVLRDSVLNALTSDAAGVHIQASGKVSRETNQTYGRWSWTLNFTYDRVAKRVSGSGTYSVALDGLLAGVGDLNLYRIASNYLDNVPLLTGVTGDTGDTERVLAQGATFSHTWIPPEQPSFFPLDMTDSLVVEVVGAYNQVDTRAMGYEPIMRAYKPSLKVGLSSQESGVAMIFGAIYDTTKAQDFSADNVGVTPLILQSSPKSAFAFDVTFQSEAVPGDGPN